MEENVSKKKIHIVSLLSFILGVCGLIALFFPVLSFIMGMVAVVLGIFALSWYFSPKWMAIVGISIGGLVVVLAITFFNIQIAENEQLAADKEYELYLQNKYAYSEFMYEHLYTSHYLFMDFESEKDPADYDALAINLNEIREYQEKEGIPEYMESLNSDITIIINSLEEKSAQILGGETNIYPYTGYSTETTLKYLEKSLPSNYDKDILSFKTEKTIAREEKQRIEEEEKKAEEEKLGYSTGITYEQLNRYPHDKSVYLRKCEFVVTIKSNISNGYLGYVDNDPAQPVYISGISLATGGNARLFDNDTVFIQGVANGLKKYNSGEIPSIRADIIEIL